MIFSTTRQKKFKNHSAHTESIDLLIKAYEKYSSPDKLPLKLST